MTDLVRYDVLVIVGAILVVVVFLILIFRKIKMTQVSLPMPERPQIIQVEINDLKEHMDDFSEKEVSLRPVKGVRSPSKKAAALASQIDKVSSSVDKYQKKSTSLRKQSEYLEILDENLSVVNSELEELGVSPKQTIHVKHAGVHHRNSINRSISFSEEELEKELHELDRLLNQSKSNPDHFISKITQKITRKKGYNEVNKKAIELVHSISQKIEGDKPIPYNELMTIKAKLKDVKSQIEEQE